MPCKRGMFGCRTDCKHREFIEAYRATRAMQLQAEEDVTQGYEEDINRYRDRYGRPVCLRDWLEGQQPS